MDWMRVKVGEDDEQMVKSRREVEEIRVQVRHLGGGSRMSERLDVGGAGRGSSEECVCVVTIFET